MTISHLGTNSVKATPGMILQRIRRTTPVNENTSSNSVPMYPIGRLGANALFWDRVSLTARRPSSSAKLTQKTLQTLLYVLGKRSHLDDDSTATSHLCIPEFSPRHCNSYRARSNKRFHGVQLYLIRFTVHNDTPNVRPLNTMFIVSGTMLYSCS